MRTIIDSDNYAASGIETMFFPGGEPHAKLPQFETDILLYLKLRTWNDVGIAICVQDALRRQDGVKSISRFIPYFPGARQDRSKGEAPLTIDIMYRLFGIGRLSTFDLHNDSWAMGPNFMPANMNLPQRPEVDFVIAPDKGAVDRARLFMNAYCPNATFIYATKERDSKTGKLSNYKIEGLPEKEGIYLVVDDICDGGGTFNLLATEFWKRTPFDSRLELFVSHGIFSKGLTDLRKYYDHFYTTNSFCTLLPQSDVTIYPLTSIVERLANE